MNAISPIISPLARVATGFAHAAAFLLVALSACPSAALAGDKPSGWTKAVESATSKKPLLWLDGTPDENRGDDLGGQIKYARVQWAPPTVGFWGESGGSFSVSESTPKQGAVVEGSETTSITTSPEGALALLFRTPSEFLPPITGPDKLLLAGRTGEQPGIEAAIVNSRLRIAAPSESVGRKFTVLPELQPSSWYWLAITWKSETGGTKFQWRLKDSSGSLVDQGEFPAGAISATEDRFIIGGSYRTGKADVQFSQVIVWDAPIDEAGWRNMESLLKR